MATIAEAAAVGVLIRDHFEPLEADFQRYYGMDLRYEVWGPYPCGIRRLWSLIRWLPPDAAIHRALNPEGWSWGQEEELLASLIEVVDMGNRWFFAANTEKNSKKPHPIVIPRPNRPYVPTSPRKQSSREDVAAMMRGNIKVSTESDS